MSAERNYRFYVTGLLLSVYVFNQLDRAVFAILMQPIKQQLSFSDTQLGFLAGPALVLFYAALGVPVARWADRSHRVNIMSGAVALWSAVVVATAGAVSFWQFALARIGVGVGEAGFSAVAQSVISDYHPPAERTRALSIFMLAIPIGGALSALLGGWINEAWGWRAAFMAAGVPGLLLAFLLRVTVVDPPRGSAGPAVETRTSSFNRVLATIWERRALRHLVFAMALSNLVAGVFYWNATFFVRLHGMSTGELGGWIAFNSGVGGALGTWLSGCVPARTDGDGVRGARIAGVSVLLACLALVATWSWPGAHTALGFAFLANAFLAFFYAPGFALVHALCASRMRTTVLAIVILLQTLFGGIVGVQATGLLSDLLAPRLGAESLRWAMVAMMPVGIWAAAHFWLAGRTISADMRAGAADA